MWALKAFLYQLVLQGAVAVASGLGALLIKGGFLVFNPVLFLSGCWVWAIRACLYSFFCYLIRLLGVGS